MPAPYQAVIEAIAHAGRQIAPHVQRVSTDPAFSAAYCDWLAQHGLVPDKSYDTVARQAIYFHVLTRLLGGLPPDVVQDYAFLHQLLARLGLDVQRLIDDVVDDIHHAHLDASSLGHIYEALVPAEERRRLGHFQTPAPVVDLMVRWAVRDAQDTILDPGVGAGVFLASAYQRLRKLGASEDRARSRLYGVDVNPIALTMSMLSLALLDEEPPSAPDAHLALADFVLGSNAIDAWPVFNAIICNPPYSRHHELINGYKEQAGRAAERLLCQPVSRLASLYVHFFARALASLAPGGRLAFITPREYLDVDYARPLRQCLLSTYRLHAVVIFEEGSLVFPGVLTSACISLVERADPTHHRVRFIEARPDTPMDKIEAAIAGEDADGVRVTTVAQDELRPDEKWTKHLHRHVQVVPRGLATTELRTLLTVKRGIATGNNAYFCLTDEAVAEFDFPSDFLQPVLSSARDLPTCRVTKGDMADLRARNRPVWLFYWPPKQPAHVIPAAVERYLAVGEQRGVAATYLCSKRNPWYVGERQTPPDAIFTLLNRGNPRYVLNDAGALILNGLHGLRTTQDLSNHPTRLKALLAWLNSSQGHEALRQAGRHYGGMLKAEPRELGLMVVPDVRQLDDATVMHLAALFDALCQAQRENTEVHHARAAIDASYSAVAR